MNTPISDAIAGQAARCDPAMTRSIELTGVPELFIGGLAYALTYAVIGILFAVIREGLEDDIHEMTGVWLNSYSPMFLAFAWPLHLVLDLKAILCAIVRAIASNVARLFLEIFSDGS